MNDLFLFVLLILSSSLNASFAPPFQNRVIRSPERRGRARPSGG